MIKRWIGCMILALAMFTLPAAAQQATQHKATLSWGASTTVGVTYNVYRAPCTGAVTGSSCTAGTYTLVSNAGSTLTFTDLTVTAGASYTWEITALCASGGSCPSGVVGESGPNAPWAATIPQNPNVAGATTGTVQ